MKKIILILFLGILTSTIATAQKQRFIEVVVEEKMQVMPDEFIFEFRLSKKTRYEDSHSLADEVAVEAVETVVKDDMATEEAIEEMPSSKRKRTKTKPRKRIKITITQQENAIKEYLKKKGIDNKNFMPVVNSKHNDWSDNRRYYTLKLSNNETFNEITKGLDSLGASRIKLNSFKSSKVEQYESDLAQKALKKAKENAQKLVAAYGEKLGKVISISEDLGGKDDISTSFYKLIESELRRKNRTQGTTITITYKVKVKFAIK